MSDLIVRKTLFFLISALAFLNSRSQISDKLYALLPATIKPVSQAHLTLDEKTIVVKYAGDFVWPPDKSIDAELNRLSKELEAIALTSNNKSTKVSINSALGDYYQFYKSRDDEKGQWVPYYESVVEIAEGDSSFSATVASAHLGIGIHRVQEGKYENASELFNKALYLYTKLKDTSGISSVHAFSYPLYSSLRLFNMAIHEQNLMLQHMTAKEKSNGMAKYYTEENYQDKALTYLTWYEATGDKELMDSANKYINMKLIGENASRGKSFHYFLKGFKFFLLKNYKQALSNIDSSLTTAEYYSEMNSAKFIYKGISLLKLGKRKEAKAILLNRPVAYPDHNLEAITYNALYTDALVNKEYPEAVKYLETANRYRDSAAFITQRGKVFEMMQNFSMIEKEMEIKDLELMNVKRQKQRNTIILAFAIIAISLITIIILLFNRGRERKYKALEAEALLDKQKQNIEDMVRLQERDLQRVRKKAIYNFRKKISRDMHDELTSALAGLKYYVNDLRLKEPNSNNKELLKDIEHEVESVYVQARAYMHNLNAGIEEVVGNLNPFLQNISKDLSKNKNLNIKLNYDKTEVESKLSSIQQTQLTLMLKEAMSNILKHSGANKIEIAISFKENHCHFSITDNGRGFGKTILEKGLGMESMELRIKRIKGQTAMHSSDTGTTIEGNFPLS